jgi:Gp37 protein
VAATILDTLGTGGSFAPPTPIDIATIEVAIVNQLQSVINTIEIIHYPDRPESYRLTHRIGAALVRYDGAKYGPLLDTAAIVQQRRLGFEITVMTRDLGLELRRSGGRYQPGGLRDNRNGPCLPHGV